MLNLTVLFSPFSESFYGRNAMTLGSTYRSTYSSTDYASAVRRSSLFDGYAGFSIYSSISQGNFGLSYLWINFLICKISFDIWLTQFLRFFVFVLHVKFFLLLYLKLLRRLKRYKFFPFVDIFFMIFCIFFSQVLTRLLMVADDHVPAVFRGPTTQPPPTLLAEVKKSFN